MYTCLQSIETISSRIMTATFYGIPQLTDTVVYSPTETVPTHEKDEFYQALACHLERVKSDNVHLVHGDFNARIGLDSHAAHPTVVGKHSFYTETNNNGDRLVELCDDLKFRPAQTKFPASNGPPLDMDPPCRPRSPARSHSHQQQMGQFPSELPSIQLSRIGLRLQTLKHLIYKLENLSRKSRLNSGKSCGTLTPEFSSRPNCLIDSVDCVQPISSRYEDFETVFKEAAGWISCWEEAIAMLNAKLFLFSLVPASNSPR